MNSLQRIGNIIAIILLFIPSMGGSLHAQRPEWTAHGPWGGEIMALGRIGSTVIAGTRGAGIYRSTDYGTTWQLIPVSEAGDYAHAFVTHGSTIIKYGGQPYYSEDGGITWDRIGTTQVFPNVMNFLGDTLIGATTTYGDVYASTNYGLTWEMRAEGVLKDVNCLAADSRDLFAGTDRGLFRSSDGGFTWQKIEVNDKDKCIRAVHISGDIILAAGGESSYLIEDRLYYSLDRGLNWHSASGMTAGRVSGFTESNGAIMAATGYHGGVFISTDGGVSWERRSYDVPNSEVRAVVAFGDTILAGHGKQWNEGISRSFDGGKTWSLVSDGISTIEIINLISHKGLLVTSDDDGAIYRSSDNGAVWTRSDIGPKIAPATALRSWGDYILCALTHLGAGVGGDIYRSSDGGATWDRITNSTLLVRDFTVSGSVGFALVANASYGEPYRSTDYGATWTALPPPSSNKPIEHLLLNGSVLFACTSNEILRSNDFGDTWTKVGDLPGSVSSLTTVGETIVLGLASGAILRSTDYGNTWVSPTAPLDAQRHIWSMTTWRGDIYVASNNDIYRSTDGGDVWTYFSERPGGTKMLSMAAHGSRLYAGTIPSGIFSATLPSSVAAPRIDNGWLSLAPNPASETALLRCRLRAPGNVRVEVFNGIGGRITVLAEDALPAGDHLLELGLSGYPPGLYLLRIETPDGVAVRRLVVGD